MQEDLLTDFNFPNINLEHLHKVFSQNTIELPTMLEEHDDFLKKNKITSPGCKGLPVPVLSKLNNRKSELFDTDEQIEEWENGGLKIVLEKLLMKNCSAVNRLNIVNSDMNELPKTKSVKKIVEYGKIASDLGWGSENDDNGEVEILEVRPYPSRLHLDQEKELPWKVDIYNYKSNLCTNRTCEDESLCNESCDLLYSSGDTEEVAFPELENVIHTPKTSQLLDSQSSLKTAKPIRCYCRKRPKSHSDFSSTVQSFESRTVDTKTENTVKEVPFCVISEVVGNADNAFSGYSVEKESPEPSVITPKKTNDITKIKGWRRKQFLVEKPTTVEFYSYEKGSAKKKIRMEDFDSPVEEPGNVENAFVCDSLDEFLDQEAELRINYEIPHLYAEVGIKLTSEHLVSKPNLSQEAFKEVGSRYCVKLPAVEDGIIILDDNNIKKREKRRNEENFRSHKMLKTEKNRKKIIKVEEKPDESKLQLHKLLNLSKNSHNVQIKEEEESKTVVKPVVKYEELPQDISLTTKLLGVVVYPSPFKPLHPVVANHLHKLRSYRTKIDKSWANFAASAVRVKWQNRYINRKILPVLCAGKIENNSSQSCVESEVQKVVKFLVDSVCEKSASQSLIKSQRKIKVETNFNKIVDLKTSLPKKSNDFGLNLTKCDVLINKIDIGKNFKVWCMEHNCYDCSPCGYARLRKVKDTSTITTTEVCEASDLCKAEVEPPPSLFDQRITSLLAKKLRGVTFSDDILTSIDKLKILIPNGLELIKLNFVKQSFLNGYINIWYLKPKFDSIRSRAFLTFSKSPPVPKAINIKRTENSFDGLPKVIKEIVSSGEISDNDEYAILHCNGASWEIHGSLNVAIEKNEIGEEKSDVEVEQIFIPVPLPEMEDIRKTAMQILRVKATKWWVLDLSQRFSEIVLNISCRSTSITRKHLLAIIKSKFLGFLAIKRRKGRLYGTYILDTLFPFILIGPYYTFEKCTLSVKSNSSKIPFVYTGLENLTQDCSLKFFINSVIMGLEGSDKKLDGLWLYDRKNLDNACYLETLTTDVQGSFPKTDYSVETEHGYCLNSLTNTSLLETNSGVFRSKGGTVTLEVPVYLYFEVFDLGYIAGELQLDQSVVIKHPLSPGTYIKSQKIGDLFISILKRRIKFIPDNFSPKWFITKHKEDLREREPFNKFFLGGAHILCKNGLCSLLKVNDNKIQELGLSKEEVLNAISESKVIHEVTELKNLKTLISKESNENLPMNQVLKKAVEVIKDLEKKNEALINGKSEANETQLNRLSEYLTLLSSCNISNDAKAKYLSKLSELFKNKKISEELNENYKKIFEKYEFGKNFIKKLNGKIDEVQTTEISDSSKQTSEGTEKTNKKTERTGLQTEVISKTPVKRKPKISEKALIKRLEAKLFKVCETLNKSGNSTNVPEYRRLIRKLNLISSQISSIKSIFNDGLKKSKMKSFKTKKRHLQNLQKSKVKTKPKSSVLCPKEGEKETNESEGEKKRGFVNLLSSTFPKNIIVDCLNKREEPEKGEISILKAVEQERISSAKDNNSKLVLSSRKINGDHSSVSSDKKFIIIRRGKNNKWSIRKLTILQAIKVFGQESNEKK